MKNKVADKVFLNGNRVDGKHYWLIPDSVYKFIRDIYGINKRELFDPCPYPKPEYFDGLFIPWGKYNYVNPPFGVVDNNGKKIGATAWWKKAREECIKGNVVFFVFPIHNWLLEAMIFCGAKVHHLGNVKWLATEDRKPGKGCGAIALFVMGHENL